MEHCPLCRQPHSVNFTLAGRLLAEALAAALPCLASTPDRAAGTGVGTLAEAERAAMAAIGNSIENTVEGMPVWET